MTENEAILKIKYRIDTATQVVGIGVDGKAYEDLEIAIQALEEIQQYRAIGTVEEFQHFITAWDELKILIDIAKNELSQYKSIGTVDEFKALKEKSVAKKVIESDCNDEEDGTWFRCPTCGAWAGDIHCEKCGQKLDWEEV